LSIAQNGYFALKQPMGPIASHYSGIKADYLLKVSARTANHLFLSTYPSQPKAVDKDIFPV
jgi:hypothetical protein